MTRTEEQEQVQHHPPSVAEVFGEDLGPSVIEELGPSYFPGERTSAARLVRRVKRDEAQARQQNAELAERIAKAREQAEADPLRGVPSAELLAARYRHRPQPEGTRR